MTIDTNTSLSLNSAQLINIADNPNIKSMHISEAPKEVFERYLKAQQTMLEMKYTNATDTSQSPAYRQYATVEVDGKVVAKLDNNGFMETSNALGGRFRDTLPMQGENGAISGPDLAQARAEFIAEALGGEVKLANTALTQSEYSAVPQPQPTIDIQAMMRDPDYKKLKELRAMPTEVMAQQFAQDLDEQEEKGFVTQVAQGSEASRTEETSAAKEEFLAFMKMTPEERYWDSFLKSKGMTEEEFQALSPEDKEDLVDEFEEDMKRMVAEGAI